MRTHYFQCAAPISTRDLTDRPPKKVSHDLFVGEINSILASPLGLLLLDHLVRSVQHRLRNHYFDLLRSFQVNHQFKRLRLLHENIRSLGFLQDLMLMY
jgi:hypothetical protein